MIPQPLSRDVALADIRRRLNDLESSPNLYGAVITGGLIQTALSGPRVQIAGDLFPAINGQIVFVDGDDVDHYEGRIIYGFHQLSMRNQGYGAYSANSAELQLDWQYIAFKLGGSVKLYLNPDKITCYLTDSHLSLNNGAGDIYAASSMLISSDGDVTIRAGSDATSTVALLNIPSTTGVAANVYMDPSTGKLSRIT